MLLGLANTQAAARFLQYAAVLARLPVCVQWIALMLHELPPAVGDMLGCCVKAQAVAKPVISASSIRTPTLSFMFMTYA